MSGPVIRIGLSGVDLQGSIALPEEATIDCPNCHAPANDKGSHCKAELTYDMSQVPSENGQPIHLIVDCDCGYFGPLKRVIE